MLTDNTLQEQHIQPSKKKPIFPVKEALRQYLMRNGREVKLPATYTDLLHFLPIQFH